MKKNKALTITLIIVLALIAISITWLMVKIISGDSKLNLRLFNTVSNELVLDETYDTQFTKIDIQSSAGDVYIKEANGNEVQVIIYGEKDNTKVKTVNNELVINIESEFCIGFCFNSSSKVEVYLPNDYEHQIKIENEYGNIEIANFENASIEIQADSGDVAIQSANIAKITNDYGNIEIGTVNEADVSNAAGNITIDYVRDAKVKNDFGDIEIDTVSNYLNLTNNCGNIQVDNITLNKNSVISSDFGDVEIGNTNEIYISAKANLGDVDINNNYQKSEITLNIKNNFGNIEVDN